MKKITITIALLGAYFQSNAQSNVVSAGTDASGSGGSVSYSVGQIDYTNSNGSGGSVTQGVQQPYEIYRVGLTEEDLVVLNLYPNPTSDLLVISVNENLKNLVFNLTDMNGKILLSVPMQGSQTEISLAAFAVGGYHLLVENQQNIIESFKIVKN